MRQIFVAIAILALVQCQEAPKKQVSQTDPKEEASRSAETSYPKAYERILEAHGGFENWNRKKTLAFTITKAEGNEIHTVDLKTRKDKIEMGGIEMGFDGSQVWLTDEKEVYKGNPIVYHNLMFYFYAMPFIFADPGINYGTTEDLIFQGKNYPGIHISYDNGVGASSKDDYYLHYDPENYQMAWLGYTFTFGSDKKSNDIRWIRYDDWMMVNDVLLPKSISWYAYEGRTMKKPNEPVLFENVSLSEKSKPLSFYTMPKNAKLVLKD